MWLKLIRGRWAEVISPSTLPAWASYAKLRAESELSHGIEGLAPGGPVVSGELPMDVDETTRNPENSGLGGSSGGGDGEKLRGEVGILAEGDGEDSATVGDKCLQLALAESMEMGGESKDDDEQLQRILEFAIRLPAEETIDIESGGRETKLEEEDITMLSETGAGG
jgi:hypothetical protein